MADSVLTKKVNFFSADRPIPIKARKVIRAFIEYLVKKEKRGFQELAIIFCSDQYLLKINQEYLNQNDYTDIISFDLNSKGNYFQGEIYISVDRVKENARNFNASTSQEILRVLFHGVLHLVGYKDHTEKEKLVMRKKEDYYLQKYSQFVSRETSST